ncbi:MAG TPA: hypothetical protein VD997_15755 [Phycisphaerales bacterium]|nr:hypothetical protein [Phycisphaerales bacterium]
MRRSLTVLSAGTMIATAALTTVLLAQIGCTGRPALPETTSEPYLGPPLAIDTSGSEHMVVIQAPTPGWVATLDRVAEQHRHQGVYLTLRRPDPSFVYPQVIVEQRVATTVPTQTPVRVYARVLAPGKKDSSAPYVLATKTEGVLKRR